MKKIIVAVATTLLLGLAVVAMAACGGGSGGLSGSDEDSVRDVIAQDLEALRDKDWSAAYSLYSPASQSACGYGTFQSYVSNSFTSTDNSKFEYADLQVSVAGEEASASFILEYNGTINGIPLPSIPQSYNFEKIEGDWYRADDPCNY